MTISATKKKLSEARFFFGHLSTEGRPLAYGDHFDFYLSAFLSAGRSVTFALQGEEKEAYDAWFSDWVQNFLSKDEQVLLDFMNDQRVSEIHLTGAETKISHTEIPMEQLMQEMSHRDWQMFTHTGIPGTRPPNQIGKVRTFPTLDNQDVVVACRRYLDLLIRLVSEFENTLNRETVD